MSTSTAAAPAPKLRAEPDYEPIYIDHPTVDALVEVVIELGAELWVTRERQWVTETLLSKNGKVTTEEIEQYLADPETKKSWETAREEYVQRVYRALTRIGDKPR